jgi:hypothetical protein
MSRPLRIQLPDGTWLRIDQDEWRLLASAIHFREQKGATDQVFVRRHADGRILIYVVLDHAAAELAIVAGEALPAPGSAAESAVKRLAARFALPQSVTEECLAVVSA